MDLVDFALQRIEKTQPEEIYWQIVRLTESGQIVWAAHPTREEVAVGRDADTGMAVAYVPLDEDGAEYASEYFRNCYGISI